MPLPLSHTRIEAWQSCPAYFKAIYIDKVPQMKTLPLLVGGFFHDWAEKYGQHCIDLKQPTDMDWGRAEFERAWAARASSREFAALPENLHDEIQEIVDRFVGSHQFDPEKVAGVEVELAFNSEWKIVKWMSPDVFFRAKLDLVLLEEVGDQRVCTIDDYKTSMAVYSTEQVATNPQLKRYVFVASKFLKADKYVVGMDYVRFGYRRTVEMSIEDAEREGPRIMAVSNQVEQARRLNKFNPTPGTSCQFCPVYDSCSARDRGDYRGIHSEAEAVEALGRLILMDRGRKEITDDLKMYTEANGAVESGGMAYGPWPLEEKTYDVGKMRDWAKAYGVNLDQVIRVSNTELNKMLGKMRTTAKKGNSAAFEALNDLPDPDVVRSTQYRVKKALED